MGEPAADCRVIGLRSVHRSDGWKAQRQRNQRRCLFITIRAAFDGTADHESAHGIEEKPEAMCRRNGHKRKDAASVGDQPISAEFDPAEEACQPRVRPSTVTTWMSSLHAIPCCPQTVLPPVPDTTRRRKKASATLRSIWSKDGYLTGLFTHLPAAKITEIKEFTPAAWANAKEKMLPLAA
jgi:hypothetical protein